MGGAKDSDDEDDDLDVEEDDEVDDDDDVDAEPDSDSDFELLLPSPLLLELPLSLSMSFRVSRLERVIACTIDLIGSEAAPWLCVAFNESHTLYLTMIDMFELIQ